MNATEMPKLIVRMPSHLKEWLAMRAAIEDRSMNAQILQLLKAAKRAEDEAA